MMIQKKILILILEIMLEEIIDMYINDDTKKILILIL